MNADASIKINWFLRSAAVHSDVVTNRSTPYFISVAPMMDHTDRHFRYLMRQMTKRSLLYTEMVTTPAILHGDKTRLLGFSLEEKPLALQLGGDDPGDLAMCARIAEEMGYDEINLNVGCPSDRVQQGRFGACLMAVPDHVALCVSTMRDAVALPVTVKHRIGIDHLDGYGDLSRFVQIVAHSGCDRFIVHARIAILSGLSPKENRTVPPLRPYDVYRLKEEFPQLRIEINGGVRTIDAALAHLRHVDGVMIGRAAYEDPYLFAEVDSRCFGEAEPPVSRRDVVEAMIPYVAHWMECGCRAHAVLRHMSHLFAGNPGARAWRRYVSDVAPLIQGIDELTQGLREHVPGSLSN